MNFSFSLILYVSFTFVLMNSCTASKIEVKILSKSESYQAIAEEKYLEDIEYLFNSDTSFVLCLRQSKPTGQLPFPKLDFFIYDLHNGKMVYEDSTVRGHVKWLNSRQIKVFQIPGIIKGDEKENKNYPGYIFDLEYRKKIFNSNRKIHKK